MIDNNHLVYAGVIMLFLICAMIVAVAGRFVLALVLLSQRQYGSENGGNG